MGRGDEPYVRKFRTYGTVRKGHSDGSWHDSRLACVSVLIVELISSLRNDQQRVPGRARGAKKESEFRSASSPSMNSESWVWLQWISEPTTEDQSLHWKGSWLSVP